MANTRISDLTASASNLASTDLAPVVQTVGVGPVKMTGLQLAGGLLGSTTFNGSTVTTSSPVLNLTQTWNAGAVTFTGLKFNATDTASASGSLLLDLQVGGTSKINARKDGRLVVRGASNSAEASSIILGPGASGIWASSSTSYVGFCDGSGIGFAFGYDRVALGSTTLMSWCDGTNPITANVDLILRRAAAATLQLGAADTTGTTAPTAQFLRVQSWSSSTTNNQTGADFTIQGSRGTGTGAGGSIIFQVAPAGGSSNGVQNGYSTALTIDSTGATTISARDTTGLSISSTSTNSIRNTITRSNGNVLLQWGASYGAGNFINSSADGDACFRGNNQNILFGCDGISGGLHLAVTTARVVLNSAQEFGWSNQTATSSTVLTAANVDTRLARDAANTLALKNSTNPQIFRAYSTTTGPSYGYFASGVTDAGVATADTLFIGTGGAGAAMTKLGFVINGTTAFDFGVTYANQWRLRNPQGSVFNIESTGTGTNNSFGVYISAGSGSTDYSLQIYNRAGTTNYFTFSGTGLLCFGGANSATVPALKRSTTTLQARLADDSAYAPIQGKLTTDTARTAGDPTTDGYLVIYDSTGTAYKVPCVAV